MKQPSLYNLVWIVDGKVKETILTNTPYAVCKWKANQLKNTTHKIGLLQPQKVK